MQKTGTRGRGAHTLTHTCPEEHVGPYMRQDIAKPETCADKKADSARNQQGGKTEYFLTLQWTGSSFR